MLEKLEADYKINYYEYYLNNRLKSIKIFILKFYIFYRYKHILFLNLNSI